MRHSYVVGLRSGKVNLNRELRDQLNLRENCVLYGRLSGDGQSAIVSSIPTNSWQTAYRLIVYTAFRAGSLATASRIVRTVGINLLSSWAAATSAEGELCWTSVVQLAEGQIKADPSRIERELRKKLGAEGVLSTAKVFSARSGLRPVIVRPLSVLAAIARDCGSHKEVALGVQHWDLDLNASAPDDSTLLCQLMKFLPATEGPPVSALITPDTEERYFRIAPLSPKRLLHLIRVPLTVRSKSNDFRGYFEAVLDVLARSEMSVYSARNVLVKKQQSHGMHWPREEAEFSFMVDISQSPDYLKTRDTKEFRNVLADSIERAVREYAVRSRAKATIESNGIALSLPSAWRPRCFFSTNAKQGSPQFHMARRAFRELQALGLHPVNVDITQTRTVYEDVTKLLRVCPILFALHLPEPRLGLARPLRDAKTCGSHAPSDWLIFEEAFMQGLTPRRGIFRMRHIDVARPSFWPGLPEDVFDDQSFARKLHASSERIDRFMREEEWLSALKASEAEAGRLALNQMFLERDLEASFG